MKKISLFLALISGMSSLGWAHEAPIPKNQMRWVVDTGILHVYFHANAPWWVLNVFGEQSPPPRNWPDNFKNAAKTYFDQHFILRADGKVLPSQLIACRYSEEVWRYYLGSQMDLEFSYALPPSVQTISGLATFYKEETEGPHETHLTIDGAPGRSLLLTPGHADFSFAFQDIVRSSRRRVYDAAREGLMFWILAPWLMLILAAFQLQWRTRVDGAAYYGGVVSGEVLSAILLTLHKASNNGYAVGVFAALLGMALAIEMGLRIYRQRLQRVSESQADRLFTSQIRFLSLLLGGMALFLIAPHFQKSV